MPNQENKEDDIPVQSQSPAQQPLQPQTCVQDCRSIVLVKHDSPLVSFPGSSRNASSTTFQSPELLIVWVYVVENNALLIHACQVSLMWHMSFLVSL